MINEMIGRFEEKNESKYLFLDDVDENNKVSKKYKEVWHGIGAKMVAKKLNMGKILKKLDSSLMMTFQ